MTLVEQITARTDYALEGTLLEVCSGGVLCPCFMVAARALPLLVPLEDADDGAERLATTREKLGDWHSPTLVLWGAADAILPPRMGERFADLIPGCVGCELIEGAHHFLQEDAGTQVGERIARFITEDAARPN